jgi:hypothetical protein
VGEDPFYSQLSFIVRDGIVSGNYYNF